MAKRSISHDITMINIYVPKTASKYMKQDIIELKGEIENLTIIGGDINILLSMIDRTSRQKISKKTEDLNSIIRRHL